MTAKMASERKGRPEVFTGAFAGLCGVDMRGESRRYEAGVSKRVANPGGGVRPT